MFLLNSFKTSRWRTILVSLLAVVLINFATVPRVHAGKCFDDVDEWITLGFSCLFKEIIEDGTREGVQAIKPEFDQMIERATKQLIDHINNSVDYEKIGQQIAAGLIPQFEATMNKLFTEQIEPLLKEIDSILATRIGQADKAAQNRLNQLDTIIEDSLKQVDTLLQKNFKQFQTAANEMIVRFEKTRDETIARFEKTRDETIVKVKQELIDHTLTQLEQLRKDFRHDVDHFLDRAENLITLLDCTEEKTRIDMENLIKQLGEELEKRCPPMLCGESTKATDDPIVLACYKKLHLKKPPKQWQYLMIYKLEKCEVLSELTPDTPIDNVETVYLDLHNWARRIACIQRSTKLMWESLEFKSRQQFWSVQ